MSIVRGKAALLAGVALGAVALAGDALAGGFAIREQSAVGQGSSFAGMAAGGALSGMFWNPAVMTQFGGMTIEAAASGIFGKSEHTPGAGSTLLPVFPNGIDNSANAGFVPSTYTSFQVMPNLWVGLSVNAPFGLTVSFPDAWAGRNYAGNTSLKTYNATPSVAYRFNDWLSIGAGVQIMYSQAELRSGFGPAPGFNLAISGTGWSYGFTAGLTVTPSPNTVIGLGWRSSLDLDIEGTLDVSPGFVPASRGSVTTKVKLPDIVTLGIRHRLTPEWTVMGTVEWSNWSRIGTATIDRVGGPALIGATPITLPFEYKDGWYFALGAEYTVDPRLTLRAGLGYEISPITDAERTPRLPDNDRFWLSAGLSYKMFENVLLDIGYSHIFVRSTPINVGPGNPWFNPAVPIVYSGTADSHVDIISVGIRYQMNPPPPAVLVTKG